MDYTEFNKKKAEISNLELAELAEIALDNLCSKGSFTMAIPPRIDDTDVLFQELIERFKKLTSSQK